MWKLRATDEYERGYKWYEKKRPRELEAVLVNQNTYLTALEGGNKPLQIKYRFVHSEGQGVIAIDQKGGPRNLAETRLYLYPDVDTEVLHQLPLGDKNSQKSDIKLCHQFVA